MKGVGWVKGVTGFLMALVFALGVPALSQAQLFPVSADVPRCGPICSCGRRP